MTSLWTRRLGISSINLFPFVADTLYNKLECLSMINIYNFIEFSYMSGAPYYAYNCLLAFSLKIFKERTNTLAYFAIASTTNGWKSFKELSPKTMLKKLFFVADSGVAPSRRSLTFWFTFWFCWRTSQVGNKSQQYL